MASTHACVSANAHRSPSYRLPPCMTPYPLLGCVAVSHTCLYLSLVLAIVLVGMWLCGFLCHHHRMSDDLASEILLHTLTVRCIVCRLNMTYMDIDIHERRYVLDRVDLDEIYILWMYMYSMDTHQTYIYMACEFTATACIYMTCYRVISCIVMMDMDIDMHETYNDMCMISILDRVGLVEIYGK